MAPTSPNTFPRDAKPRHHNDTSRRLQMGAEAYLVICRYPCGRRAPICSYSPFFFDLSDHSTRGDFLTFKRRYIARVRFGTTSSIVGGFGVMTPFSVSMSEKTQPTRAGDVDKLEKGTVGRSI